MLLSKYSIIYTSSVYTLSNFIMLSVWQCATADAWSWLLEAADAVKPQSSAEL